MKNRSIKGLFIGKKGQNALPATDQSGLKITGSTFTIAAVLLWLLDMWGGLGGEYRGLNFKADDIITGYLMQFTFGNYLFNILAFILVISFVVYYVKYRKFPTYQMIIIGIFSIVMIFFLVNPDWAFNLKRFIHFFFIIVFSFTYIGRKFGWEDALIFISALLVFDFFIYSIWLTKIGFLQFFPFLPMVVMVLTFAVTPTLVTVTGFLVFSAYMFVIITTKGDIGAVSLEEAEKATAPLDRTIERLREGLNYYKIKIREGWEKQMAYATGGYYEGKVEENVREPLGVYIENLKGAETEFNQEEDVIVWGTIKARTLDEREPVNIALSCVADKDEENKGKAGEIIPTTLKNFRIETFEEEDFSCKLSKNALDAGSHNIKFFAEFNFKTMAYLKTYFMDQERRRAMIREGIDIFEEYKISDTAPTATYTNGPVKIGAETTKTLPVGIDKEGRTVRLGVTIENQWQGRIKRVEKTVIEIPDSMVITSCDVEFDDCDKITNCNGESAKKEEGYKKYSVNLNIERFANIKTFKSFNCILMVKDKKKLIGVTPLATRYYRITTKYVYELESSISINIKGEEKELIEGEDIFIPFTPWLKVKATIFSAKDEGAYGGSYSDMDLYAALPARLEEGDRIGGDRMIEVAYGDKSVRVPVVSIGPWFIDDDYWNRDGIPFAQNNIGKYRNSLHIGDGVSDKPTYKSNDDSINGAGIDLSEGVFNELGISGTSAEVKWRFVGKQIPVFEIWPVDGMRKGLITSDYGTRFLNGKQDKHDGIDIGVPTGTPVKSVADGTVESICDEDDCSGYGKNIIIKHSDTLYTRYNHLSEIKVKDGDAVSKGDVIAESGDTGVKTGPHLDFKVYTSKDFEKEKDKGVDPINYLPSIG